MLRRSLRKALSAAVRLNCPRCGQHTLFRSFFAMHPQCSACGFVFEREPGYFVGAIYINYAVTASVTIAGFLLLDELTTMSVTDQIVLWSIFGVGFPLFFFRYSRSLWLAFDYFVNPEEPQPRVVRNGRV